MAPRDETRPPTSFCPIEAIAQAYLRSTAGNEGQALRIAITDALADLMVADRRARARSRLISRGYVHGGLDDAAEDVDRRRTMTPADPLLTL